ncbi:MAG: orotate phosphoribosyltransferase [Sumerlaeia bacterium]
MADILEVLKETGALKEGHFLLSSGLHSGNYCQCAALFEHPDKAELAARAMAEKLAGLPKPDVVLAPALGGVLWGYELARALGVRSIFAERPDGISFALRRGFVLEKGQRVLLAEDVITTGKSVSELLPIIEDAQCEVVGFAAVANRSGGKFAPGHPVFSLVDLNFPTYQPADCPLCREGKGPAIKPGSRANA